MNNDIIFQTKSDANKNQLGIIILNRPKALNALSREMFLQLQDYLHRWEKDHSIKAVLIKSSVEKSFCAGGDLRGIYENKHHSHEFLTHYFKMEYDINRTMYHYKKPIIPLLHGIVMGGGVGLSVHASHCTASEEIRWAMPETLIGFFPDVGVSYYLSRLPNAIGTYLALLGTSISAAESLQFGFIKFVVPHTHFDAIENKLIETIYNPDDHDRVSNIIQAFSVSPQPTTLSNQHLIAKHFAFDTIENIFSSLSTDPSDWAQDTLHQLQQRSPTSLKVALRQLQDAQTKNIDAVFDTDATIAQHMIKNHDFYEGVRAVIIDKDKNPQWKPARIEEVKKVDVDAYFE